MIDIDEETLITLKDAAGRLPSRPHLATLHRWVSRGVGGVRLESVRVGGSRYTSVEALARFAARCSETDTRREKHTPHGRRRKIEQAERRLDEIGI